jgi:hypothetical protein
MRRTRLGGGIGHRAAEDAPLRSQISLARGTALRFLLESLFRCRTLEELEDGKRRRAAGRVQQ